MSRIPVLSAGILSSLAGGIELNADSIHTYTRSATSSFAFDYPFGNDASAGDTLFIFISVDGTNTTVTPSPADLTQESTIGPVRHTGIFYSYEITSGDISAGSKIWTFSFSATEVAHCRGFSFKNVNRSTFPEQSNVDTTTSNVTTKSGISLTGVGSGSLLLALCNTTPDGGTNGLTVTDARSFVSLGGTAGVFPTTVPSGGTHSYAGYRIITTAGTYTGPDFANDSTTGPGNVTNPGLYEAFSL